MNALTTSPQNSLSISGMQDAMKLAQVMASAKMVPQHLQGSAGDCLMVIEQAMRWQMSPFAVAQATAVVRGKMCFEGKLIAAAVQTSGVLDGRLDYAFEGSGDTLKVIVSGHIRGEKSPRTVEVRYKDACTDNAWWKKTPEQMLSYHGARVWARRHTPEVMLGVYAPDEFDSATSSDSGGTVIDVTPEHAPAPQQRVTEERRPIDYEALFDARLLKCTDTACVDGQWKAWAATVDKAQEVGRPIAPEIVERVQAMISDRMADMQQIENQRAAEYAEADAEEVPA